MKKKDVIFGFVLLLVASLIFLGARGAITGYFTFDDSWNDNTEWDDNINTVSETYSGGCPAGGCSGGYICENNSDGFVIWLALCQSFELENDCLSSNFLGGNLCSWGGSFCTYNSSWSPNNGNDVYAALSGIPLTTDGSSLDAKDLEDPTMISFKIGDLYEERIPVWKSGIYQEGCVVDNSGKKGLFGECSNNDGCLSNLCTPFGYCSAPCYNEGASYSHGSNTYYYCYKLPVYGNLFRVMCLEDDDCSDGFCNENKTCVKGESEPEEDNSVSVSSSVKILSTCQDLKNIMDSQNSENLSKNYILNQSFSCSAYSNLEPIGTDDVPFTGTFDGKGHTISDIKIGESDEAYIGLFSYTNEQAIIVNLKLNNFSLEGHSSVAEGGVGGLVGKNLGIIKNCHILFGEVIGNTSKTDRTSTFSVGGLVGYNEGEIVYSSLNISSLGDGSGEYGNNANFFGGLAGSNNGKVSESYSSVQDIKGKVSVGGLVGENLADGIIFNSYSEVGNMSGADKVGGLVGYNEGKINNSYSKKIDETKGLIIGKKYIGGLVGQNKDKGTINNSYSTGFTLLSYDAQKNTFYLTANFGGWCKVNSNQPSYFGGLVGSNEGVIKNSFASENILDPKDFRPSPECVTGKQKDLSYGELIGSNDGTSTNNFYYVELDLGAIKGEGTIGKYFSKFNFSSQSNEPLKSWDFTNVWEIKQGYTYPKIQPSDYESPDCVYVSNNLADDPQSDKKCVSRGECIYDGTIYSQGERIFHNDSVYICSSQEWEEYHPMGSGSLDDPYQIIDCLDLQSIGNKENSDYYKLLSDVDCTNSRGWSVGSFLPINHFRGQLDGNNYAIKNLYIYKPGEDNVGLFGETDDGSHGTIKNIQLVSVNVTGDNYVGGLVGQTSFNLSNVTVSGEIRGKDNIGGLVGYYSGSLIENCSTDINSLEGDNSVGGLVGNTKEGIIKKSFVEINTLNAKEKVGGLVGENSGNISESYVKIGNIVNGSNSVGGLVGLNKETVNNSFVYGGGIISADNKIGGLIGNNEKKVDNSYVENILLRGNKGEIGGLVGENSKNGKIESSFSSNLRYDFKSDATNKGMFVGKNNGGDINNGYYFSTGAYSAIGSGNGNVLLVNSPSQFYSQTNDPLKSWNFDKDGIWKSYTSTYPKLQAFPLKDCLTDDDCSDEYCDETKTCHTKEKNFEDCNRDEMCESDLCYLEIGYCTPRVLDSSNELYKCSEGFHFEEKSICVQCIKNEDSMGPSEYCENYQYCENHRCVQGCSSDNNCSQNEFCSNGRCFEKREDGESCNTNSQCKFGVCFEHECVACTPKNIGICNGHTQYCSNNECKDKASLLEDCSNKKPCEKDLLCPSDLKYCTYDSNGGCPEGFFQEDYFCIQCDSDSISCGYGKVCDNGRCVNECNNLGSNESCGENQYCNGTQCVDKKGFEEVCTNGQEFADWMCQSKICKDVGGIGLCMDCISHENCTEKEFCFDGECIKEYDGGQGCQENYQCSGKCLAGTCVSCTNDNQCKSGEYCDTEKTYKCFLKKELFVSCSSNKECGVGLTCMGSLGYCTFIEHSNSNESELFNDDRYCVQCLSHENCTFIDSDFCKTNYLCANDSYLVGSISLSNSTAFNQIDTQNNQFNFTIDDPEITINSISSHLDSPTFKQEDENLSINLSLTKVGNYYNYSKNSTSSINYSANEITLVPEDAIKLNVSYGDDYNTIIEIPLNYTLVCSPSSQYNFTHLNSENQQYETYYCINGKFCKEGRPCAVIREPLNGTAPGYRKNVTFDFFKYPNNQSFNYSWSSDRLSLDSTKKPISSSTIGEYFLGILGYIDLTLNISKGDISDTSTITFISSTETPSCYRTSSDVYWVYNDTVKKVNIQNTGGEKCDAYDGYCCPYDYGCINGVCWPSDENKNGEFGTLSETSPSCSSYTTRGDCESAIFNLSTYSYGSLRCGNVTNITTDDGTNQTIRTDCDCAWNVSGEVCFTNATETITKYCLADSDCSAGKYCDLDADIPTCKDISNYCTHNENCTSGKLCNETEERCYEPEGYCTKNIDCLFEGKYCNTSNYRCELCSTDSQCGSNHYCSATGHCRIKSTTPASDDEPYDPMSDLTRYVTQPGSNNNQATTPRSTPTQNENLKWLWIIPTIIFIGVIILVIFILKKHNVKKNKFDSEGDYKKNSSLPPSFPPSTNSLPMFPQKSMIQNPPRQPINQQFPPRRPQPSFQRPPFNPQTNPPKNEEKK